MKKLLVAALASIMMVSFVACNENKTENNAVEGNVSVNAEKTPDAVEANPASKDVFGIDCEVGQYITLGRYEQDNNLENGKEDIEWLVLDKVDGKALVVSRYGLDSKKYNETDEDVTWETCSLRNWLNGEFLTNAFDADELLIIPTVTVPADKNPEEDIDSGNATEDKIFLLSVVESEKYIYHTEASCGATDYAFAQGVREGSKDGVDGLCRWWTRTPGETLKKAAYVNFANNAREYGQEVTAVENAIRPAMWVSAE